MAEKNYFINGITELLILSILKEQDSYVYEITKKINEYSKENLSISQNTIYAATYKLENDNKISEYSQLVGKKRTRIYYHIEEDGIKYLNELKQQFSKTVTGVENIMTTLKERTTSK